MIRAIAQSKEIYESLNFKEIHADILDYLPRKGSTVLDIGCGSARDPIGFKNLGYDVTAVDPNSDLISELNAIHKRKRIKFLVDRLPCLNKISTKKFDLIMLTGVWQFISPEKRLMSISTLANMLNYKGSIVIYLKRDFSMHDGFESEIKDIADLLQLRLIYEASLPDVQNRRGIHWKLLKFKNKKDPIFDVRDN